MFYFGVYGVKGDTTKTTNVVSFYTEHGAKTSGTTPPSPDPSVYEQILSILGSFSAKVEKNNNIVTITITDQHGTTIATIDAEASQITREKIVAALKDDKPNLFSGDYNDLSNKPDINTKIKFGDKIQPIDSNGYVTIPYGTSQIAGLMRTQNDKGTYTTPNGTISIVSASEQEILDRKQQNKPITPSNLDFAYNSAFKIAHPIKTQMDATAVAGASYFLGELKTLKIKMPANASVGQQIVVVFASGEEACLLECDLTGFNFTPVENKTNKITFTLIQNEPQKWLVEVEES